MSFAQHCKFKMTVTALVFGELIFLCVGQDTVRNYLTEHDWVTVITVK